MTTIPFLHICEVCGTQELLTPDQSYTNGWDYPPNMGAWGVVSPRTCSKCPINKTLWWTLAIEKKRIDQLDARHTAALKRILEEEAPRVESN